MSDQERTGRKRTRHRRRRAGDPELGLRVRKARLKAGLSQGQAAHQVDRSDRWLLEVENGRTDPGYGDLMRLAPVLNVEFERLVLDEPTAQRPVGSRSRDPGMMVDGGEHLPDGRRDALKRRGFLHAGLVMTGGMAFGLWPGSDGAADAPELAALRRTLLRYGPELLNERPDLVALRSAIRSARADLQASRYSPVVRTMQALLADARRTAYELDGQERIVGHELLAHTYRLIFNLFRKFGDSHLATIAADRGMQAAQTSGNPTVVADLAACLCVVLADGHNFDQAIDVCSATAAYLKADAIGRRDPASLSIYGQLLLSGAEAAAQAGDDRVSDELYREAESVAQLLGEDANHSFTAFGPTNITVHRVHAAVVLGDGERAVRLAKDLDITRLPVLERRAHHLMDMAVAFGLIENAEAALSTLLSAEEMAAEEVLLDPGARSLVMELQQRTRQRNSQLGGLAKRMRLTGETQ